MAVEHGGLSKTLVAGEAITKFRAVKIGTGGKAYIAEDGEPAFGIAMASADANKPVAIRYLGTAKAEAGETITAGSLVTCGTSGKLKVGTVAYLDIHDSTDVAPVYGDFMFGFAQEDGANGEIIEISFTPMGIVSAPAEE